MDDEAGARGMGDERVAVSGVVLLLGAIDAVGLSVIGLGDDWCVVDTDDDLTIRPPLLK